MPDPILQIVITRLPSGLVHIAKMSANATIDTIDLPDHTSWVLLDRWITEIVAPEGTIDSVGI